VSLSELPRDSGTKHAKVFQLRGWIIRRLAENIILTNPNFQGVTLSIPNHREVKLPLLHAQIKRAGMTDEEYRSLYDSL
jgi:hypothetical protein